jgi:predicted dehydrogenase
VRRLRIAVVGTGFGARIQVPGLRASGRFDVAALVGRDAERTRRVAERLGVEVACTSLEDALATSEIDAVAIATPPATHAPLAIAAARAGKHVLCEKPMARSLAEAQAMCDAVHAAGVVGAVGFEFRFHPARAMLARMIARGDLGEPQLLVCVDTLPLYVAPYKAPPAWWYDADAGGGWLGASGSHLLDAARVWLGEVCALAAIVDTLGRGTADDTFALLLRMASGARAVLQQSAAVRGPRLQAFRLSGSDGTAWIDEAWRLWRAGTTGDAEEVRPDDDLDAPDVQIPPESGPFAARELPSFVRLAERFGDAIAGRSAPPAAPRAATFGDGLACQRLMDAARAASRSTAWVEVES